jgi:hypothetical protein
VRRKVTGDWSPCCLGLLSDIERLKESEMCKDREAETPAEQKSDFTGCEETQSVALSEKTKFQASVACAFTFCTEHYLVSIFAFRMNRVSLDQSAAPKTRS